MGSSVLQVCRFGVKFRCKHEVQFIPVADLVFKRRCPSVEVIYVLLLVKTVPQKGRHGQELDECAGLSLC